MGRVRTTPRSHHRKDHLTPNYPCEEPGCPIHAAPLSRHEWGCLQHNPHLIRSLEAHRFIQRPPGIARMQHHRIDTMLATPFHRDLHQMPRQSKPPEQRLRIDIQNIPPPSPLTHHMRRPIHQPQSSACGNRSIISNSKPPQILTRRNLLPHPWSKSLGHLIQYRIPSRPHLSKHRPPMRRNRSGILHRGTPYRKPLSKPHPSVLSHTTQIVLTKRLSLQQS